MRHVVLLAFDGVQLLDVSGPASVFGAAADETGGYRVTVASAQGGPVRSSCGVSLGTEPVAELPPESVDLLLVAGGDTPGLAALIRDDAARRWMGAVSVAAARYGSVCTGSFVLAHWGLLDGHRVATHWQGTAELARRYPALDVDPDALFVESGRVWTSAGITTGIDMSLAIVAHDHCAAVADRVARRLVLHARRSGSQSQFSSVLDLQMAAETAGYGPLIAWIADNLGQMLDTPALAARAGQSARSFHRNFRSATGQTPAAMVEALRLDRARELLAVGLPLKRVAAACGFAGADRLGRAVRRRYGVTPSALRERLRPAASSQG